MAKRIAGLSLILAITALVAIHGVRADNDHEPIRVLDGRLIAVGIPGVSTVAPVGTFLAGGPIPAHFAAYTQPGQVLDPKRILVGSASNFGEPLTDPSQLAGSFLSIDQREQQAKRRIEPGVPLGKGRARKGLEETERPQIRKRPMNSSSQ